MADVNKEILEIPAADPLDGTEQMHIVQGANSRRATIAEIADVGRNYIYGGSAVTDILADEWLMDHLVARDHEFEDNFANGGLRASVGTNPDASWVGRIYHNGAQVGTLTVSDAGVVTVATSGGALSVLEGDLISLRAPAVVDASIGRLRWTFAGTPA